MPILNNWIESPLNFVTDVIENAGELKISTIKQFFEEKIKSLRDINEIPSLNNVSPQAIKPDSLVRCQCMVQDQFDPEYYLGIFETVNKCTGVKRKRSGIFRDSSGCKEEEEIIYESKENVTLERQSLYCVPVPAENSWVKDEHKTNNLQRLTSVKALDVANNKKREWEDETGPNAFSANNFQNDSQKKPKPCNREPNASHAQPSNSQNSFDPNFPLPDEKGTPYMVVMYDTEECIKLNEVVEFIGILSCEPLLATATMGDAQEDQSNSTSQMMSVEECSAHCPPSSLVPRLHCILSRTLRHCNPLLIDDNTMVQDILSQSAIIRESIVQSMTHLLFGDRLAAEFLLLNIISRVYGRVDVMSLGKFSLNLTKCPSNAEPLSRNFPSEVGKFLELITTKSHCIPLTISNLNKQRFVPRKDYNANRLLSGILQLSEGTHLVLDETALEPGRLDATGVQNLTAIGNVIQWQKVEYDFQFHKCDIKTDITILILSEARSLMQCDCLLPLEKKHSIFREANSIIESLDKALLSKIRVYLDLVRLMDFSMSDEMQEVVKQDYVAMRESDPKSVNPDTFHLLLVMARLVSLSYGKDKLTNELWNKTKELETERRQRCA